MQKTSGKSALALEIQQRVKVSVNDMGPGLSDEILGRYRGKLPRSARGCEGRHDDVLKRLVEPHVASFDWFLSSGLKNIVKCAEPHVFRLKNSQTTFKITLKSVEIGAPQYQPRNESPILLTPQMCRDMSLSYTAPLVASFEISDGVHKVEISQNLGQIPLMVGCSKCVVGKCNQTLNQRSGDEVESMLIKVREDNREVGGYFISSGTEKLLRLLVLPKQNYFLLMERAAFRKRGATFSDFAVAFKNSTADKRAQTILLHYLKDGSVQVRILAGKKEYFFPLALVLKALTGITDFMMFKLLACEQIKNDPWTAERAEAQCAAAKKPWADSAAQARALLGSYFRNILFRHRTDLTDQEVGVLLLQKYIFCGVQDFQQKSELLIVMCRLLWGLVRGVLKPGNSDATSQHDLLLPGHLFTMFLSEQLQACITHAQFQMQKMEDAGNFSLQEVELRKAKVFDFKALAARFHALIATGNLNSESGLDLQQQDGFSVTADRLNFPRFLAHFRSVHRGKFFTEMKSTSVRKMLPEAYGFQCPVHTPDGALCGLLNHLCYLASAVVDEADDSEENVDKAEHIKGICYKFGVQSGLLLVDSATVVIDGQVLGQIAKTRIESLETLLRNLKVRNQIYKYTEIIYDETGILNLITTSGRYTRRVFNLKARGIEHVSPCEQLQLQFAIYDEDIDEMTTHQELGPTSMLSTLASLIPYPDHNQSPRNMYECQMLKQTMGTPSKALQGRFDAKTYRIMTPQRPLVHTQLHTVAGFDSHPTGTTAVVAVLAYSGYDMEDSCLISKAALERGIFAGTVYHCEDLDAVDIAGMSQSIGQKVQPIFKGSGKWQYISPEGLPELGTVITPGDALAEIYIPNEARFRPVYYEGKETGVIEQVLCYTNPSGGRCAKIVIRHDRSPVIGDKFASRHGQKGTLSIRYPGVDMPYSHQTGMQPDLIINPHAFPSRMTVGMLLESLAGKAAGLQGKDVDATPFNKQGEDRFQTLRDELRTRGFDPMGSEIYYSGLNGTPLHSNVFVGLVYYQRLRHMIYDKFQVRSTGKIDAVTRQPLKGRKRGGGIRFGEMERDALLSHGSSALLRARLCVQSDATTAFICTECGSPLAAIQSGCKACGGKVKRTIIPTIALVLSQELAAMGIHMKLDVE